METWLGAGPRLFVQNPDFLCNQSFLCKARKRHESGLTQVEERELHLLVNGGVIMCHRGGRTAAVAAV